VQEAPRGLSIWVRLFRLPSSSTRRALSVPRHLPGDSIYVTTPFVLVIALAPFSDVIGYLYGMEARMKIQIQGLFLYLMFAPVATLLLLVLFWERRPLNSFGLRAPRLVDIPLGVAFFLMIVFVIDTSTNLLPFLPHARPTNIQTLNSYALWWQTVWAIGAASLEAVLSRLRDRACGGD